MELERQKTQLNVEHTNFVEQPKMKQRQLRFLFLQGQRREDESEEEYRNRLIDIFVDSVYLFDDKIVVTYNLRGNNSHPIFAEKKFTELEPILAQYSEIIRGSMALKFGPSKRRKRCGAGSFKNDN